MREQEQSAWVLILFLKLVLMALYIEPWGKPVGLIISFIA
jgi:hypothetical protein